MVKFLNSSFDPNSETRRILSRAVWSSVCVFLFILFFQPFELTEVRSTETLFLVAGMGLIILIAFVVFLLIIPQILARWFQVSEWEEGPPDLLNLAMWMFSATGLAFYIRFVAHIPLSIPLVVRIVLICLVPSVYIRVDTRIASLRRRVDVLKQSPVHEIPQPVREIEIRADNGLDVVRIPSDRLLYITSADNYVEVIYRDDEEIRSKLLRTTLKKACADLAGFSRILQCHRAFVVNLNNVRRLRRSTSGYFLELKEDNTRIPVSRAYQIRIKDAVDTPGDR